jgi:hypothetical protein
MAQGEPHNKATHIYGLVDPTTNELRYVGKTVVKPSRRALSHRWLARNAPRKNHVQAWLAGLHVKGHEPEIVTIETVPAGGDWVEAEQFWIAYFRMIGANLCNLTIGGEGAPGRKHTAEEIEKRVKRGAAHHRFGKKMPDNVKAAMMAAGEQCRKNPEWVKWAAERRQAGQTPEAIKRSTEGLRAISLNPERKARRDAAQRIAMKDEKVRKKIGAASRTNWSENREKIIAAQNAGKGEAWSAKQSSLQVNRWVENRETYMAPIIARRKLSDGDVVEIRGALSSGVAQRSLAKKYGVDQSLISRIKSGSKRASA